MNLIITDNEFLFQNIISILKKKEILDKFEFVTTSKKINIISKINLREEHFVEALISKYTRVFSIHCQQIFPPKLVKAVKCYNLHPGYNPINRGWYPQVFAIINNRSVGATLHEIDLELDNGPIIERRLLEINLHEDSKTVYDKILNLELAIFENNIQKILGNDYETITPETEGYIYHKSDFNNLTHIDLNEKGTFLDFYNRLRALNFPGYKNAYITDPETGSKIHLSLNIVSDKAN